MYIWRNSCIYVGGGGCGGGDGGGGGGEGGGEGRAPLVTRAGAKYICTEERRRRDRMDVTGKTG
jgi:hypothetical protein